MYLCVTAQQEPPKHVFTNYNPEARVNQVEYFAVTLP